MHEAGTLREYAAWDRTVRWFHWINVLCVLGLAGIGTVILFAHDLEITSANEVKLKTVHALIGYVFVANLSWRLVWAFVGGPTARWRAFLPFGRGWLADFRSYVAALIARRPRAYAGHNPAGRLAVGAMFVLLLNSAVTGLVIAGTDLFYPPFGGYFASWVAAPGVDPETVDPTRPDLIDAAARAGMREFRKPFKLAHEYGFYALAVLIVLHLAGVVITEVIGGGGLTSALFTGRKVLHSPPVDHISPSPVRRP